MNLRKQARIVGAGLRRTAVAPIEADASPAIWTSSDTRDKLLTYTGAGLLAPQDTTPPAAAL